MCPLLMAMLSVTTKAKWPREPGDVAIQAHDVWWICGGQAVPQGWCESGIDLCGEVWMQGDDWSNDRSEISINLELQALLWTSPEIWCLYGDSICRGQSDVWDEARWSFHRGRASQVLEWLCSEATLRCCWAIGTSSADVGTDIVVISVH